MTICDVYIGLGSNIAPAYHIGVALHDLADAHEVTQIAHVYRSKPVGFDEKVGDFWNTAISLQWNRGIEELRVVLKRIEQRHGRARTSVTWKSRTIDLDILMQCSTSNGGHTIVHSEPHTDILQYAHVAIPLADIAGEITHPRAGSTIQDLAKQMDSSDLTRLTADDVGSAIHDIARRYHP